MTKREQDIKARTEHARNKLALYLGTVQGMSMRDAKEHYASDHVMLTTLVNGEPFSLTWGELALCAGASAFGGHEPLTAAERDAKLREIARDICREFGFPVPP